MKKWTMLFILVLIGIQFISANLVLRVSDISPSSVEPNQDFTVGIQLENQEDFDAKEIILNIKYIGEDLQLKENRTINLGTLRKNGGIENLIYHFHVSQNAVDGERVVELTLYWSSTESDTSFKKDHNFLINIISDEPELTISGIKTSPERIIPKEDIILTIKIENYGEGIAKNVRVYIEELDFEGVKEIYLGEINPHESLPARFVLKSGNFGRYDYTLKIVYEFGGKERISKIPLNLHVFRELNYFILIGFVILLIILFIWYIHRKFKIKIKTREETGSLNNGQSKENVDVEVTEKKIKAKKDDK